MKIQDAISLLRDNAYYASLFPEQAQNAIFEYVFDKKDNLDEIKQYTVHDFFMTKFFNEQLKSINDDSALVSRFIVALMSCCKSTAWLTEIDIKFLLKYIPGFFQDYMSKNDVMMAIFNDGYSLKRKMKGLKHAGFTPEEIKDFCLDPCHKTNELSNYENNLYLYYVLRPLIERENDIQKLEQYLLEYIRINLADYSKVSYYPRDEVDGSQYRVSLPDVEINKFIALIEGKGNWDGDISSIYAALVKASPYCHDRDHIALFHCDEDFGYIIKFICADHLRKKREKSQILTNLYNIIRLLDPNLWIDKSYFHNCFSDCSFKNTEVVFEELDLALAQYPEMKDEFINYLLRDINDHYICCLNSDRYQTSAKFECNSHLALLSALVDRFGAEYIWDVYTPDRSLRPELIYTLIAKIAINNQQIQDRKETYDYAVLNKELPTWTKTEKDAQILLDFVLTGKEPASIAKLALQEKSLGNICWLNNIYNERLAQVFFNGKNNKFAYGFLNAVSDHIQQHPLRLCCDFIIQYPHLQPAFFKGFAEYTSEFIERCGDNYDRYRFHNVEYFECLPRVELQYLQQHQVPCVEYSLTAIAKYKAALLACLKGTIIDLEQALLLTPMLKEKAKGLIANVQACIRSLEPDLRQSVIQSLIEELPTLKGIHEINVVEVICFEPIDKEQALTLLDKVKEPQSRTMLAQHGQLDFTLLYQTKNQRFDLAAYLSECYSAPKKFPIDENLIQGVLTRDGQSAENAIKQLVLLYQNYNQLTPNPEAVALVSELDTTTLQHFNCNLLATYSDKITTKNRWLLNIPALHGDANTVKILAPMIDKWANGSKHQLAAHIIKLMGASGVTEAYVVLDRIGRNNKKQSIKDAVEEAFVLGAERKGISKGELGDTLVGDLGFVGQEIPFQYCEQNYALVLTKDLKFAVRKPDGKVVKSLPKPKVDDDAQTASEVAQYYTAQKKLLKDMVTLQTHRLEDAFVVCRLWYGDKWNALFIGNPVMNQLASKLVWGIYQDNVLLQTFIVNPTPMDRDDDAVMIADDAVIGLVHPSELNQEALEQWQEYLADWEITPLFEQLDRQSFTVTALDNALQYKIENPSRKSPSTVINRLRKKGWNVGSVRDGGSFDELYKEIDNLGIGVEITFDNCAWHGGFGYECDEGDIAIGKIEFYCSGVLPRGSYCYAELDEKEYQHLLLDINELPPRLSQELIREAINAFL
ncbi:TPA: DUF4132 domain-containing protein [Photobacterium damselae]